MTSQHRLSRFSHHLWLTVTLFVALAIAFVFYVRSEKQIDRANDLRHQSFLLADELRQSSDDLTRMARTYVVTGDPVYARRYQDILDIREGKQPRPEDYQNIYWDLALADGQPPYPANAQTIPLLELMRQAGFTDQEFQKLAEAKASSDALTATEFAAMQLVKDTGPEAEAHRAQARLMLYDSRYHQAKAAIMRPIAEFYRLVDQRTLDAVHTAATRALIFRWLFIGFGLVVLGMLWQVYTVLRDTLGGSVDTVYAQIAQIGAGDLSPAMPIKAGLEHTVLGWLSATQAKLIAMNRQRQQAEEALRVSEARIHMKLDSILSPDGDLGVLELADVLDVRAIQTLLNQLFDLTQIAVGILDLDGRVLVATGWQDICVNFHRAHPQTCRNCVESDTLLSRGVEPGTFKIYRCKNQMYDMATPIIVGGRHLGNVFLGQFFFDDEPPNRERFRTQARHYGFSEEDYLAALDRAPRWSREKVNTAMTFYTQFAHLFSTVSYSNLQLAQSVAERETLLNALQDSEEALHRSLAEMQRHHTQMVVLNRMNDLLLSCETQVEAYEVIASSAGALFVGCSGGLAIREATAQNLRVVATWGHERTLPATFLSDACWALRRGEPYEVADPPHSIHCQHFTTPPAYAYLCVPLTVRGETFGLLQVSAATDLTGEAFHEWRTLILKVSGSIKLALSNLKLREALREQAIHDALTGLFNRRYLDEALPRELRRCQRTGESLAVAMLDLDHFKGFNDTFGHEAGDAILRAVSELLWRSSRAGDLAFRYGGEELTLILFGITADHAQIRLDSLRQAIAQLRLLHHGNELPAITVSIGVVVAGTWEMDAPALLGRADAALYQAKTQGRNRVVVAPVS